MPSLEQTWRCYLRRFAVDRPNRLAKQRLHWTLPQVGTPQQAERWSDLMPLMTWQLWLARAIVKDHPLPWQRPQTQLTPGRVAQGFPALLAAIGTPAGDPEQARKVSWLAKRPTTPEENSLPSGQKDYAKTEKISKTTES